jgi:hypothetical protein
MARKVGGYGLSGIFYIAAVVLFLLAAFKQDLGQTRVELTWLGLAFFAAAHIA